MSKKALNSHPMTPHSYYKSLHYLIDNSHRMTKGINADPTNPAFFFESFLLLCRNAIAQSF